MGSNIWSYQNKVNVCQQIKNNLNILDPINYSPKNVIQQRYTKTLHKNVKDNNFWTFQV